MTTVMPYNPITDLCDDDVYDNRVLHPSSSSKAGGLCRQPRGRVSGG